MTDNFVVVDVETKESFLAIGAYDASKLSISVAGVYTSHDDKLFALEEHELDKLWPILEHADRVIGFNLTGFDYPVMQKYYHGSISELPTLDLLDEFKKDHGFRIKLDNIVKESLGEGKSGDGLMAIRLWEQGKIEDLKKYCLDDVRLTRDLFLLGRDKGEVYWPDRGERKVWAVNWKRKEDNPAGLLTLPF